MNNDLTPERKTSEALSAHIAPASLAIRFAVIMLVITFLVACGGTTNLNIEAEWLAAPGAEKQMLTVRSHEQRPLVIKRITVNGEVTAQEIMNGFQVENFREVTLTIGESAAYAVTYPKRILYVDIVTDRGTCRYEFDKVESQ